MDKDTDLIKRLLSDLHRESAFRELVKKYKIPLYWHIRKIVITHQDADDVLQNTFLKVFKNISKFKGESKLYTWMYKIATNEALNFLRYRSKQKFISSEKFQQKAINNLKSDPYFEGSEIQIRLQKAINQLPKKQQLVFNMRYFDEIKYKEMALILDTSEGSLKASYHIAVKKIKEFLDKN